MKATNQKIAVENVNHPGHTTNVDAEKYWAMRKAMLDVIPITGVGLTHREMAERVKPLLPESLFPGGAKTMWWSKTVQLDLEAKGLLVRLQSKPLRWRQSSPTA